MPKHHLARFSQWVEKIPEPFSLSLLLTAIAFAAAAIWGQQSDITQLGSIWVGGLWSILGFSMQMVLCLASGFALAQAQALEKIINRLCLIPKNFAQAVAIIAFISMCLGILHWGLGLAGGTLLVKRMREENNKRGFYGPDGLMAAAGYLPLMVWHGGLSGSAPMLMSSDNHFLMARTGIIGLNQTVGHWSNFITLALLLIVLTFICYRWAKMSQHFETNAVASNTNTDDSLQDSNLWTNTAELRAPWIGFSIGLFGVALSLYLISQKGFSRMGLNELNSVFLFLALLFHARLGSFLKAFQSGVLSSWSVVLLFPFYGALMSLVKDSGLASSLSEMIVSNASMYSLPLLVFFSAGFLNIFIPSGGGQWVVQGPVVIESAQSLGVSNEIMVMAVAYGDQLTNMIQPFWALPLLGMTHISSKELLRYTIPLMFFGGAIMIAGLFLHTLA